MKKDVNEIKKTAIEDYRNGAHCAEVVLKYIGREYADDFDENLSRMATPFGGGVAERGDICGALAGGLMLIGYLSGRRNTADNQEVCWSLSQRYYDRFKERFGSTNCYDIHSPVYDRETHENCVATVDGAVEILCNILDNAEKEEL